MSQFRIKRKSAFRDLVLCVIVVLFSSQETVFSQNFASVNVNQDVNILVINGVSSLDDIGGVECNALNPQSKTEYQRLKFTNYNEFNVSVLYKLEILEPGRRVLYKTGTIILERGETKTIQLKFETLGDIRLIVRKMGSVNSPIRNDSEELRIVAGYLICYPQTISIDGRANANDFIKKLNIRRVYTRSNWRLPSDSELNMLGIDNSDSKYYSTDNWNRYNVHPTLLIVICDK